MRLNNGLVHLALAAIFGFVAAPALAAPRHMAPAKTSMEPAPMSSAPMVISVGKSRLLELRTAYSDVMIGDPKVADVLPLNNHSVYIVGKTMGSTSLTIYGKARRIIYTSDILVSADLESFKSRLHEIMPGESNIAVSTANQSIVLSGTATSPSALKQALTLAETYDPGKVVNMMSVQGTQQVMLSVRFVEMERTTAKNLRLNVQQSPTTSPTSVTVKTGDDTLSGAVQNITNTFGSGVLSFASGGGDLSFMFDALETKGLIKTLAEPTLVAMSGDTANFLAGGEFPIPISQSSSGGSGSFPTITVQFKPFGISLAFTPTILQDGMLNMVVNPEVSSIDPSTSVQLGEIVVPGIKVRRAHTTVELRDGESFTIAGLLSDDYQNNVRQYPWLGDLPIIGTLFRSTSYQADQTELVIVVTPHLVTPRKAMIATPADHFVPPSDFELFLFGNQRGKAENLKPEDRALMSADPSKGGVDGAYGHVLY